MARELLNNFLATSGIWNQGQPEFLFNTVSVNIGGGGFRVHETAQGGHALLSPAGASLVAFGDAEVYLTIFHSDGSSQYCSAPVRTTIEFSSVQRVELTILYLIGNAACSSVAYNTLFNAHCIFERF